MKNLYIPVLFIFFLACGNKEQKEPETNKNQNNSDEIVVTASQFNSENMALGTLENLEFNEVVKVRIKRLMF